MLDYVVNYTIVFKKVIHFQVFIFVNNKKTKKKGFYLIY